MVCKCECRKSLRVELQNNLQSATDTVCKCELNVIASNLQCYFLSSNVSKEIARASLKRARVRGHLASIGDKIVQIVSCSEV